MKPLDINHGINGKMVSIPWPFIFRYCVTDGLVTRLILKLAWPPGVRKYPFIENRRISIYTKASLTICRQQKNQMYSMTIWHTLVLITCLFALNNSRIYITCILLFSKNKKSNAICRFDLENKSSLVVFC